MLRVPVSVSNSALPAKSSVLPSQSYGDHLFLYVLNFYPTFILFFQCLTFQLYGGYLRVCSVTLLRVPVCVKFILCSFFEFKLFYLSSLMEVF